MRFILQDIEIIMENAPEFSEILAGGVTGLLHPI